MSGTGRPLSAFFGEEERLRARIARDTRRLAVLRSRSQSKAESRIAAATLDRKRFSRKSYIMFIADTVTSTRGYEVWDETLAFFRRFRLISATLRIAAAIVYAIETGAAFILAAGIIFALSPAILLFFAAASLDSVISGSRALATVERLAADGAATFVFSPRGSLGRGSCLEKNAGGLAASGTVFIVSPYLFSARGAGGRGAYAAMRHEGGHVYIIRRRMFFRIRRKMNGIFSKKDTTLIYL